MIHTNFVTVADPDHELPDYVELNVKPHADRGGYSFYASVDYIEIEALQVGSMTCFTFRSVVTSVYGLDITVTRAYHNNCVIGLRHPTPRDVERLITAANDHGFETGKLNAVDISSSVSARPDDDATGEYMTELFRRHLLPPLSSDIRNWSAYCRN